MNGKYRQQVNNARTHFTKAPMGEIEFSRMSTSPTHYTDFSAGEIVPIYNAEVLPHDTFDLSINFDIRQATALVPSMGRMLVDIYAFFVPNRVVNKSWKNVQGENSSGSWTAPQVSLAPLCTQYDAITSGEDGVQVPVCSVADYYGYPTQYPLDYSLLSQSHDLLFRGYLECYNVYFRDENYQPNVSYSKLNVYNGFFLSDGESFVPLDGQNSSQMSIASDVDGDGSYPKGAVVKELYGEGGSSYAQSFIGARRTVWSALSRPLKANKLHDYFTSVLPSPQKGNQVVISSLSPMPVITSSASYSVAGNASMRFGDVSGNNIPNLAHLSVYKDGDTNTASLVNYVSDNSSSDTVQGFLAPNNLYADPTNSSITLSDLRMSAAIQQVYEIMGRSGSRYVEMINSFFGLEIENPFDDVPTLLGHIRRDLDLYQVAQTSQSEGSAVGSLGAFGYTSTGGHLFNKTFLEHGYIHVFAVVRHRNVYSSLLSRDKFRMSQMDFYQYPLANIGEQPVYTREINPFLQGSDGKQVFGYQEAWAEYRMEQDQVSGHMRNGVSESLSYWNYSDYVDSSLLIADGEWLKSNSAEVLNRSIAIADTYQPQFKAQFTFGITKQRPMPTYSVAGLDIL